MRGMCFIMKLIFKQRIFSWLDSYDIYNEAGETVYTVKGQLSWGHCFKIFDAIGNEIGYVKEVIFSFMPKFEIYINGQYMGGISKEFTFFIPKFDIDYNGWHLEGDFWEWDYSILNEMGQNIATITKEIFSWADTYVIDVNNPHDAIGALMLVLAIDAEKCSRKD